MDILLINPDHKNRDTNVPWGVLSVGSYLRNVKGYRVRLIDASLYDEEVIFEKILHFLPETSLVGLTCLSSDTPFVKKITDFVKTRKPACKVIIGGAHAILFPEQSVKYKNIDFVAYGDGEETAASLIEELRLPGSEPDFRKIPGLVYKAGEEVKRTSPASPVEFYNMDYSLLDSKVTESFKNVAQVLTGRGCSYKCTFCFNSITSSKYRGRSAGEFIAEVETLIERYDPKRIYFRDEHFFQSKERILEFIKIYRQKGFHFHWEALSRVSDIRENHINGEVLKDLTEIKCYRLKFGLESGSDKILRTLKKGLQVEQIKKMVEMMSCFPEIILNASFLIGIPGETYKDYCKTLNLIGWILSKVEKVDIVGPQYYRMYAGGELYSEIAEKYHYRIPKSFEEWVDRYLVKENDSGNLYGTGDSAIDYPWIAKKDRYLVKNAFFLPSAITKKYNKKTFSIIAAKTAILPLTTIIKLRFKIGWYRMLWDVRLLKTIRDTTKSSPILKKLFWQ